MPVVGNRIELSDDADGVGIENFLVKGSFRVITTRASIMDLDTNVLSVDESEGFKETLFKEGQIVYVQDANQTYQLETLLNFGPPNALPNPNLAPGVYLIWSEFTGFGSSNPSDPGSGGVPDPLTIGGLTVNPGSVGTTLTLTTGSDGSTPISITGQSGGRILQINSASLTPVMINNKGLIVLDDYPYFPTVTEGSLLYKDGDFYVGTPDLDDSSNNLATNINFTADFTGGDFDNNGDPANTVEVGTGTAPAFDLTTFSGGFGQDYTFRTLGSIYSKKQITLLKFFLNSNAFPEESGAKVLVSKSSTFEGPHSPDIKFTFNLDASYNEILIDSSKFTVYYLYFIFTKPLITYSISNIRIIRISDF